MLECRMNGIEEGRKRGERYDRQGKVVFTLQTGFNTNSWIRFESTSNLLQSHAHYHFAMQIGSVTNCTCTDDCHMTW